MKFRSKNAAPAPKISPLLKSITLSGLVLTVVVIGINLWTLREDWRDAVNQAEEMAVNLSLSQARQAEDTFLQTELSLREVQRDLQTQIVTDRVDGDALSQTMRLLQNRLPQLHGLFYYDAQGRWIATSMSRTPIGINNSDREYFSYHRASLRSSVHVGPVLRSRTTGDLVIPVSLRVNDGSNGFDGVLLATIKVDYFRHFYSYYELGARDVLVLMLADSTVLYARPKPDSYIGKNLSSSPLFRKMLADADQGSGQWKAALDGEKRIFGFARSQRYPLIVAAGYDKSALFSRWINERVQDVMLSLALLAVILSLSAFLLRQARHTLRYQRELTRLRDELTAANLSLQSLANSDGLTGVANRRYFDRRLYESLQQARVQGWPVSLILIDIDYFKHYNDTYGHVAGDECLKTVASILKNFALRKNDLPARYGGEEFAIILPRYSSEEASKLARAIVEAVYRLNIPHLTSGLPAKRITLSAGCATQRGIAGQQALSDLIERADEALYRAKRKGRNRAECEKPDG
ncbi:MULTISPECIES: sensor domain-containing diguanylate cyclase [Pantoea]|uniref:diguanylate cyclase n=1 Tax=Pantoea brenneri TaxID=472694 RepID=A0A7Y6TU11_9GAMM|nr:MULTISPECIES: sensor domain-containing diguanylate cyclase [Pantoea]MBZ6397379.1 sensor domain-containing diguanylate cyclase [Pantoea sp.]MBZ6440598.1 sensor domain-containing diguanylate cyclase [Pantoea sp.]NUY43948.1 GGDEF domain-containing protein [Pantoea brenneri]NUY51448.1 GGDEF domain-containing protein [Pantoea brenneri]NUY61778.1 GGDEF domain-containing protein [Pantoea brenneri]